MIKKVFADIYQHNNWASDESVSGHGSTVEATETLRRILPLFFEYYKIKTVLDIPCGDFNWAKLVKWPSYIGADIVPEIIFKNKFNYPEYRFYEMDITSSKLPCVDMVLVRDLFGHFSNYNVKLALENLRASGSTYLLATTFPDRVTSGDITTGDWRPINLASYYGLPDPIICVSENCTVEGFEDKSLGLWRLN